MRSWKIGSVFGIGLYVHWSFLLLPIIYAIYDWDQGPLAALLSAGVILALFFCVGLHELGHALMARVFGVGTRDITMYPIGGIARLERMPESPIEELLIAVAGPLVNVVIAAGLWIGMYLAGLPSLGEMLSEGSFAEMFLTRLFLSNVGLVVFNMIPAYPMDGGRVLRSVLALFMPHLQATQIAVTIATIMSILLAILGIVSGNGLLVIVSLFVIFVGRQELAMLRYREHVRSVSGRQEPLTVLPVDQIAPAAHPDDPYFSGFTWDRRHGVWVEWRNGCPVGACAVGRNGQA